MYAVANSKMTKTLANGFCPRGNKVPLLDFKDRKYAMTDIAHNIDQTQQQAKEVSQKFKEGLVVVREEVDQLVGAVSDLASKHADQKIKQANTMALELALEEYPELAEKITKAKQDRHWEAHSQQVAKGPKGPPAPEPETNFRLVRRDAQLDSRRKEWAAKLDLKMKNSEQLMAQLHKGMFQKKRIQGWLVIILLGKALMAIANKVKGRPRIDQLPNCSSPRVVKKGASR